MKHTCALLLLLFFSSQTTAQTRSAKDWGCTHLTYSYKGDPVDILICSKSGEEKVKKPLFLFAQGSLPRPLLKYSEAGDYPVFPFDTKEMTEKYHLVIVGKPYIPLIANTATLDKEFNYIDASGKTPKEYSDRNFLTYYSNRNIAIIKYLQKQPWVFKLKLVAAGHSEGSTVVAKMASVSKLITHVIYSGGNPLGRIMSVVEESRRNETDSTKYAAQTFKYWQEVVNNKTALSDDGQGDSYRATFEFSIPPIRYLEKLKIPVLVTFGTKDYSAPANDYLQADCILKNLKNFQFNAYIGTEHNFFPLNADNSVNYDIYNWDKVATDWMTWLQSH